MTRFLKFIGITLAAALGLCIIAVGGLYAVTGRELSRRIEAPPHGFTAPTDSASIVRGEHLVRSIVKCVECHGADLAGGPMMDDPAFGQIVAANLTSGGRLRDYPDADLERAIRHGLARDGRRLMIMPSEEYQSMSDEDLGAVIAYLRSVPAVKKDAGVSRVGPVARALLASSQLPLFGYEKVTHGNEVVASVPADTTVEFGHYLADIGCRGCHGQGYGGGKMPTTPPDFPIPANITPGGIGHYTFPDFVRALRDGVRPGGTQLNDGMPVNATKLMTDVELVAVWKYLRSLPPREFGTR